MLIICFKRQKTKVVPLLWLLSGALQCTSRSSKVLHGADLQQFFFLTTVDEPVWFVTKTCRAIC
jgi:hypothetical protein